MGLWSFSEMDSLALRSPGLPLWKPGLELALWCTHVVSWDMLRIQMEVLTQIYPTPTWPLSPSGPTASLYFSLSRTQSQSPGASPWAAMWASTASPTSWSASRSLRASASTSSVWVSVMAWPGGSLRQRMEEDLLGDGALLPWPPVEL